MRDSGTGLPGLGLVLPPVTAPDALWPTLEMADTAGFESIWVTDRILAAGPWLDALTLLGAVAARTERVRIGTSVLSVARRNPVYTAHALATVQHLSNGRLTAGVGLGSEPSEYAIAGIPMSGRAALTDEYISLMRRLWSEPNVTHDGPGYRCADVTLAPRPERAVPIWIGGNSPGARRRAGRTGDGWLSVFAGPDQFAEGWEQVAAHAAGADRDPADVHPAAYVFAAIGSVDGQSEAVLDPAMRSLFGAPLDQSAFACIYGTPARWVDTLVRFGQAGARTVNLLLFTADLTADVELICEQVLPELSTAGDLIV